MTHEVEETATLIANTEENFLQTEEAFFPSGLDALQCGVVGTGFGLQLACSGWGVTTLAARLAGRGRDDQ